MLTPITQQNASPRKTVPVRWHNDATWSPRVTVRLPFWPAFQYPSGNDFTRSQQIQPRHARGAMRLGSLRLGITGSSTSPRLKRNSRL